MQASTPETPALRRLGWLWPCRVMVLLALGSSAALYVQYLNPVAASFCGLGSGCEAVRRFGYSYFLGTPLISIPLFGLVAYGAVFWLSLRKPDGPLTVFFTGAGALAAVALVLVQAFVVRAFCWLCLIVDVSAVFAFLFALLDRRSPAGDRDPLKLPTWYALAALVVVLPVVWPKVKPEPAVPPVITALYEPGKINVVEFADFECPFCRMFHPVLQKVMASYPAKNVRFLRKHVPLPSHEDARPAARTAVCAEAQGKGEAIADQLMKSELTASAIREAAVAVGVDVAALGRCLATSDPDRRIDADTQLLEAAGMFGLPTTYVEGKRLLGVVSEPALRDAFDRAARGETPMGVPAPIYVTLSLALLVGVAWLGRKRRGTLLHEPSA